LSFLAFVLFYQLFFNYATSAHHFRVFTKLRIEAVSTVDKQRKIWYSYRNKLWSFGALSPARGGFVIMGKLIVIEGTDGSGKSTQFKRLTERLQEEGKTFQKLVFPQYAEPSSALIRMYLGGEFGSKPTDVNAYAASAFGACDGINPAIIPNPKPSFGYTTFKSGLVCSAVTTCEVYINATETSPFNK
jgi:hypothetical protein